MTLEKIAEVLEFCGNPNNGKIDITIKAREFQQELNTFIESNGWQEWEKEKPKIKEENCAEGGLDYLRQCLEVYKSLIAIGEQTK